VGRLTPTGEQRVCSVQRDNPEEAACALWLPRRVFLARFETLTLAGPLHTGL
jgi:hypothetical protein